jgi:aldehyde dehydrogenase (NAD+)
MGHHIGGALAKRFGRALLELGGNNASSCSTTPTSTSRCAPSCSGRSGRRAALHDDTPADRAEGHRGEVRRAPQGGVRASAQSGDPLQAETLMGPLIDGQR